MVPSALIFSERKRRERMVTYLGKNALNLLPFVI